MNLSAALNMSSFLKNIEDDEQEETEDGREFHRPVADPRKERKRCEEEQSVKKITKVDCVVSK